MYYKLWLLRYQSILLRLIMNTNGSSSSLVTLREDGEQLNRWSKCDDGIPPRCVCMCVLVLKCVIISVEMCVCVCEIECERALVFKCVTISIKMRKQMGTRPTDRT